MCPGIRPAGAASLTPADVQAVSEKQGCRRAPMQLGLVQQDPDPGVRLPTSSRTRRIPSRGASG